MTKFTIEEFGDWRELCKLETLLEKRVSILRLNLPSREKLLSEVKVEINKLTNLEKERA